jgi:hypothetical protein
LSPAQVIPLRAARSTPSDRLAAAAPAAVPQPSAAARLPHRGRPSDRLERWSSGPARLEELERQARALGLSPVTAGCLLVEAALIVRELGAQAEPVYVLLDKTAAGAGAAQQLSDASALHLRAPGGNQAGDEQPVPHGELQLPARLTDRILRAGGVDGLLAVDGLERARRWEIAALLEGQSMSEWSLAVRLAAAGR